MLSSDKHKFQESIQAVPVSIVAQWHFLNINASQTRQSLVLSRSGDLERDESLAIRCVRAGYEAEPISLGLVAKQLFSGKKLKPLELVMNVQCER